MIWLKACRRCKGDLVEQEDIYGRYIACLHCGHHLSQGEESEFLSCKLNLVPQVVELREKQGKQLAKVA
jgi:hypothetical protein